jgi:hypothetical protein
VFGRFCFGGDWRKTAAGLEIVPKDGVRRRFHALLGDDEQRKLHLVLQMDRFATAEPIVLKEDLSEVRFRVESDNPMRHVTRLLLSGLPSGKYAVLGSNNFNRDVWIQAAQQNVVELPIAAGNVVNRFTISRQPAANR